MHNVTCPTLLSIFDTVQAAGFLRDCLAGNVVRTKNKHGDRSCSSYEVQVGMLLRGETSLKTIKTIYPCEGEQFEKIARMWAENKQESQTTQFKNWIAAGFPEIEPVKFYPHVGHTVQEIAPVLIDVLWLEVPETYCPFIWALEGQYYEYEYDQCWEDAQEVSDLWESLLFDGELSKEEDSGCGVRYTVPDLGVRVALNGATFEEHSKEAAYRHNEGAVLLLTGYNRNCWAVSDTGGLINKDTHYYDMVVPLVGGVPQWNEWAFAPFFEGCKIIPISEFLRGDYVLEEEEAEEPPIRGKLLARAKRASYTKGKKLKLAA